MKINICFNEDKYKYICLKGDKYVLIEINICLKGDKYMLKGDNPCLKGDKYMFKGR